MLEVAVRGFKGDRQGGVPQRLHILLNVSRAEKKSCHEDYEDYYSDLGSPSMFLTAIRPPNSSAVMKIQLSHIRKQHSLSVPYPALP